MVRIRNVDDNSIREVKTIDVDKLNNLIKQRDNFQSERDTLIDDLTWYKAKVKRLNDENERLIRRNEKLEAYVRMWDKVKDLRKELLEITPNHQLLIGLGLYMNELERDMYKGRS